MAKAKAGVAEQGPPGPELPGAAAAAPVAALEAEVAALKQVLAGTEAKVAEKRELAARVAAELAEAEREAEKGREDVAEAEERLTRQRARLDPAWRDWAGLPEELLVNVAGKLIVQTEAGWAAYLKEWGNSEEEIQEMMEKREHDGNCCLFVFARVCKPWRKAPLKVGGPLRTRVMSDVILPGSVALAKWALAEGCPREGRYGDNMAHAAARYGHLELVKWLCGEGGFAMDEVMEDAAMGGNLELVQWLRGESCPWSKHTCYWAVEKGHVEVLRWARGNGCPWTAEIRDWAARELGYTDELGNLVWSESEDGFDEDSDDE